MGKYADSAIVTFAVFLTFIFMLIWSLQLFVLDYFQGSLWLIVPFALILVLIIFLPIRMGVKKEHAILALVVAYAIPFVAFLIFASAQFILGAESPDQAIMAPLLALIFLFIRGGIVFVPIAIISFFIDLFFVIKIYKIVDTQKKAQP